MVRPVLQTFALVTVIWLEPLPGAPTVSSPALVTVLTAPRPPTLKLLPLAPLVPTVMTLATSFAPLLTVTLTPLLVRPMVRFKLLQIVPASLTSVVDRPEMNALPLVKMLPLRMLN